MPVIGKNATLITDENAAQMAEHGIPRISVSLDFPTAAATAFMGRNSLRFSCGKSRNPCRR